MTAVTVERCRAVLASSLRVWALLVCCARPVRADDAGPAASATPAPAAQAERGSWGWLAYFHPLLGVEGGTRSFVHREPSTGEKRPYEAQGFSGALVGLEIASPRFRSFAGWSVKADYWHSIAFSSWSQRERGPVPSPSSRLNALARLLLRTAESPHAPVLGVGAGVGRWTLEFELPESPMYEVPTGNYTFVRGAFDVRQPIGDFALFADASYLHVFDAGPLGNRRVKGNPQGTEAAVGVAYAPIPYLELRLRFMRTLFVGELAKLPGRSDVAASIQDEYLTFGLSAVGSF